MPLQTRKLMMLGLPVFNDAPPNAIQPTLSNGIHLRWMFKRDLGFPWHGFHLFRRPAFAGTTYSLINLSPLTPQTLAHTLHSTHGQLTSDTNLVATDSLGPAGTHEFSLNNREFMRFHFSETARWVQVKLGFLTAASFVIRGYMTHDDWDQRVEVFSKTISGSTGVLTASFAHDVIDVLEITPSGAPGQSFLVDLQYKLVAQGATDHWEPMQGLWDPIRLPVTSPGYPATSGSPEHLANARALARGRIAYGDPDLFTPAPALITSAGTVSVSAGGRVVTGSGTVWPSVLEGQQIVIGSDQTAYTIERTISKTRLVISRPYGGSTANSVGYAIYRDPFGEMHDQLASLVAGGPSAGPQSTRSRPEAVVTAGAVSVAHNNKNVVGHGTAWNSSLVGLSLRVQRAGSGTIELTDGHKYVAGTGTNWTRQMADCLLYVAGDATPYRIAEVINERQLRLTRAYRRPSVSGKAYRIADREAYRIDAVTSATRLSFDRPFAGPEAREQPYRIGADLQAADNPHPPVMPQQHPLDLLLLATLHPAVAQMLGLYWIDTHVDGNTAYDYMIAADFAGTLGTISSKDMYGHIYANGF
ncbi:MAG TPA: hypothetical protein VD886_22145, partial [Herpetosiphonaceae bacterium]|nr:hypothetical protein [Herpetosiphonaceae bacterium]